MMATPTFGPSTVTAADSFAATTYPPPPKKVFEIRTLPEAVRATIRVFAPIVLGLGILGAFSGGFCFVSSIIVLVQGALWLLATSSGPSLAFAVVDWSMTSDTACCGGTFIKLRGLAIAGIVFACVEVLLGLCVGIGVGYIYVLSGVSQPPNVSCSSYYPYNCQCYVTSPSVINPIVALGIWLFYAAGNSIIVAALNISLSVSTLHLLRVFAAIQSSSPPPSKPPPIVVSPSKTMDWAVASSDSGTVSDWSASSAKSAVSINPLAMSAAPETGEAAV